MGKEITRDFQDMGAEQIDAICLTNGSILFAADLLRHIDMHVRLDCIRVSSYQDETRPVTEPQIFDQMRLDISNGHVLLIDDILDTGRTCSKIVNLLNSKEPAVVKTCMLLEKKARREVEFVADYIGFNMPDEFVVGYGLDFAERYRNLPCIGVLKPELQNPPQWL